MTTVPNNNDDPSVPRNPNETDEQYGARLREAEAAKSADDSGTTTESGTDDSPDENDA